MTQKLNEEKRKSQPRPYPKQSPQEALKAAEAFQNGNNGKSMKAISIAKALGMSPPSTNSKGIECVSTHLPSQIVSP
ncbi:MAG: hypothetical protein ACQCN4_03845 [Candidatus Bathyarchaeia archaeon]|jgi:hypothetical protein